MRFRSGAVCLRVLSHNRKIQGRIMSGDDGQPGYLASGVKSLGLSGFAKVAVRM